MTDGASFDDLIAAANSGNKESFRAAISSLGPDQVAQLLLMIVTHQWELIDVLNGSDAELTPAELLRFAAAGRREYARTAPPQDQAVLNAEAAGYEEAAKLVEDPARLWAIIPTAMPAPAGKIDPRQAVQKRVCKDCQLPEHRATRENCPNGAGSAQCLATRLM